MIQQEGNFLSKFDLHIIHKLSKVYESNKILLKFDILYNILLIYLNKTFFRLNLRKYFQLSI